jgi:hypothetical protein
LNFRAREAFVNEIDEKIGMRGSALLLEAAHESLGWVDEMTAKVEKGDEKMMRSTIDIIKAPPYLMQTVGNTNIPKGAIFALKALAGHVAAIEPVEEVPPTLLDIIAKLP